MLWGIIPAHDQGGEMEFLKAILMVLIVATAGMVLWFLAVLALCVVSDFCRFVGRNIARLFNKEVS